MRWSKISAFILISICSCLLVVSHGPETAFASVKLVSIQGEGFGNNGFRFNSFVDCANQQHQSFHGGSYTHFTADLSNLTKSKNGIGTWMIEYKNDGIAGLKTLVNGGSLTNGSINGSHYSLTGLETVNSVCGGSPTPIILTGECGQNTAVSYQFANGEKTGSTVPPSGDKVDYLFGSDVRCTADSSNNQ
jgi:hypothetical protein